MHLFAAEEALSHRPHLLRGDRFDLLDDRIDRFDRVFADQQFAVALTERKGGLQREPEAADVVVLGLPQLFWWDKGVAEFLRFVDADRDRLGELLAVDARRDGEDAGVREVAVAGADRVGEAALFAHFAEEARGHSGPEHVIHDSQREPVRVVPAEDRRADVERALVDVAAIGDHALPANQSVVLVELRKRTRLHVQEEGLGGGQHLFVRDVPGDR